MSTIKTIDPYHGQRLAMVEQQIVARGIQDPRVLDAMRTVPRHLFVPEPLRKEAYADYPLELAAGQTISQPYIVAFMSEAAEIKPTDRVLEIGTGSGYQTAILASLAREVYSIEIMDSLAHAAKHTLDGFGLNNIHFKIGDGYEGWADQGPFDVILMAACAAAVPPPLLKQMAKEARLIAPVVGTGGDGDRQELVRVRLRNTPIQETLLAVRFVPLLRKKSDSKL